MQVERLALDSLANPDSTQIPHLDACEFCAARFAEFKTFYMQTDIEFRGLDLLSLEKLVQQKLHPIERRVYRLDALHLMPSEQLNPLYTKTLAADSEISTPRKSIRNIGVYTSSDERLMVRILKGGRISGISLSKK